MNTVRSRMLLAAAVLAGFCGLCFAQQLIDPVSGAAAIESASSVEQLLAYSEEEKADIFALIDGDDQIMAPGVCALLRRISMTTPELEAELIDNSAIVPVEQMVSSSAFLRGKLLLVHLDVYKVSVIDTKSNTDQWWTRRPAWRLDCLERGSSLPLVLVCSKLPNWLSVGEYPRPKHINTTALYAKIIHLPRSDGAGSEFYPLLVASDLHLTGSEKRSTTGQIVFFILIVLLAIWWFISKRIASDKTKALTGLGKLTTRDKNLPPTGDFDAPAVNEKLVQEIKKYQKRRNGDGDSEK